MTDFTAIGPNRLRRNSLGLVAVTFMVISAAAPLTGVAGAMPLAFLLGNGTGIPLTSILLTLIMLAFAAGYVAIERVTGSLGGRKGTFALQHYGIIRRGAPELILTVIPDSGADELAGLEGKMRIVIANGAHSYEFDYDIGGPPEH